MRGIKVSLPPPLAHGLGVSRMDGLSIGVRGGSMLLVSALRRVGIKGDCHSRLFLPNIILTGAGIPSITLIRSNNTLATMMEESISLEETNKIRISIGLEPLTDDKAPTKTEDQLAEDNFNRHRDSERQERENKYVLSHCKE